MLESHRLSMVRTKSLTLLVCLCLLITNVATGCAPGVGNWSSAILASLQGVDRAAKAMPPTTTTYIAINLLGFKPDRVNHLITAFSKVLGTANIQKSDDILKEFDQSLKAQLGITLAEDVIPWIGPSIGIGIGDVKFDEYGNPQDAKAILAIEALNTDAADKFIIKIKDSISKMDVEFTEQAIGNVKVYVSNQNFLFCRSGNMVLLGTDLQTIQSAIEAQKGKSFADSPDYQKAIKPLPADRLLSIYVSSQQLQGLSSLLNQAGLDETTSDSVNNLLNAWRDLTFSLTLVNDGIQTDMVTGYNTSALDADQKSLLETNIDYSKAIAMLPDNSLAFMASGRFDTAWKIFKSQLTGTNLDDFNTSMSEAESQLGFNVEKDLVPYLNGAFVTAVYPSSGGALTQMGVNLGAGLFFTISESAKLSATLDKFNAAIEKSGNPPFRKVPSGDLAIYELLDNEQPVVSYGLSKDTFGLSSSDAKTLAGLLNGKKGYLQSPNYQKISKSLGDLKPVIFVDIKGILAEIEKTMSGTSLEDFQESIKYFAPVTMLTAGGNSLKDGIVQSRMVIYIP